MRTHTSDFKNLIKKKGRMFDSIVSYEKNGETIELGNEQLNSITPSLTGSLLKSIMKELIIDSNEEIEKGTIINYRYGLMVGNNFEYIDFGNYIVESITKKQDTGSYEIKCYDKMLLSMKDYEDMNLTYPITIRNYLQAICTKLGIVFASANDTFTNYDKTIKKELYLTDEKKTLGYTFRDVLDEIAQATASIICINEDDELEVRYINNTNDTIDEEYLADTNVNTDEIYGPVNTIVLSRSSDTDLIYYPDPLPQNPFEIKIKDNQILNGNDRDEFIVGIYNRLNGLQYYPLNITSTGICYYEIGDRFNVNINGVDYPTIMLSEDIFITQGLSENIYSERLEYTESDYKKADKTDRSINQASLIVDKQQASITLAVNTANDAKTTAEGVATTANTALSTAQSASSTASSAQTTANNAQTTASSAQTTAQSAQTTANTANTNANTAIGQLSLKIDKGDTGEVISAFNLNSNQVQITSDNFSLTSAGRITATSGNIAGFDMTGTKFSKDVSGKYTYLPYDMFRALDCYLRDSSSSTSSSQIMDTGSKKLLDTDNNNKVELLDAVSILNYVIGQATSTKTATGKFYINSDNPRKCVQVVNSDNIPAVSLGVNGVDATNVGCTTLSCADINANSLTSYSILTMYGKLPELELHKYVENSTDHILRIRPQGFATNYGTLKRYNSTDYTGTSYEIIDRSVVTATTTKNSTSVMTSGGVFSAFGSMLSVLQVDINVGTILANDEQYDKTYSYSVGSGYTALGVVGFHISGSNYTRLFCNKLECDSSNIYWSLRNSSNLNTTNVHLVVKILRVRTS